MVKRDTEGQAVAGPQLVAPQLDLELAGLARVYLEDQIVFVFGDPQVLAVELQALRIVSKRGDRDRVLDGPGQVELDQRQGGVVDAPQILAVERQAPHLAAGSGERRPD